MSSSIYSDDKLCQELTERAVLASGTKIFQIDRISSNEQTHVLEQYKFCNPAPESDILDLACGVGMTAQAWLDLDPSLHFTLNNISGYQLSECPENMARNHASADATGLQTQFDVVMLQYGIGYLDLPKFFLELDRLVKPGGKFFLYDLFANAYLNKGKNNLHTIGYNSVSIGDVFRLLPETYTLDKALSIPRKLEPWHAATGITEETLFNTHTAMLLFTKLEVIP